MSEGFGKKVVKGLVFLLLGRGASVAMNILVGVVLSRILGPEEIGLVTIATVCSGFADIFSQLGLQKAIVQREHLERRHLDTAFWTDMAIGALFGVGFAAAAPVISAIYGEPRLIALLMVLALAYPASAFGKVHSAQIRRSLRFRELAQMEAIAALVVGVATIVAAVAGLGAWAIIIRVLLTRAVASGLYMIHTRWVPRFFFERQALRDLFSFSMNLFAAEIVAYIARSLDRLIMGHAFSTETLGYYSRAHALVVRPLANLMQVLAVVLFPAMSRIQNDLDRIRNIYLTVVGAVSLISFPVVLVLIGLADELVVLVLGEEWLPAADFVRILAPVLLWRTFNRLNWTSYNALGRADVSLKMTLITRPLMIVITVCGLPWGPLGMAVAYLIGNGVTFAIQQWVAMRLIRISFGTLLRLLAPIGLTAGLMGLGFWGALYAVPQVTSHPIGVIALALSAALVSYVLALALVRPRSLVDLLNALRRWRAKPAAGTATEPKPDSESAASSEAPSENETPRS